MQATTHPKHRPQFHSSRSKGPPAPLKLLPPPHPVLFSTTQFPRSAELQLQAAEYAQFAPPAVPTIHPETPAQLRSLAASDYKSSSQPALAHWRGLAFVQSPSAPNVSLRDHRPPFPPLSTAPHNLPP